MDWQLAIAFGALVVGAIGFLSRSLDKGLSIREHEEFRNATRVELDRLRVDLRNEIERMRLQRERDNDTLTDRIKVLEQTRPTTGEIEARLEDRMDRRERGKGRP